MDDDSEDSEDEDAAGGGGGGGGGAGVEYSWLMFPVIRKPVSALAKY